MCPLLDKKPHQLNVKLMSYFYSIQPFVEDVDCALEASNHLECDLCHCHCHNHSTSSLAADHFQRQQAVSELVESIETRAWK